MLANAVIGTAFSTEFALPDVESRQGFDILDEHFAGSAAGGEGGTIVFRAEQGVTDPEVQAAMTEFFDRRAQIEGITIVSPYARRGAQQIASQGPEAGLDRLCPDRRFPRHDLRGSRRDQRPARRS